MSATASQKARQSEAVPRLVRARQPRLIRQASAWVPRRDPEPLPLQDLELSDGVRWVDIYGGVLGISEVLGLLAPICDGQLNQRMVRDLITPKRFAVGVGYRDSEVVITSGFRIRHLSSGANGSEATNGNGNGATNGHPVYCTSGDSYLSSCQRIFGASGQMTFNEVITTYLP